MISRIEEIRKLLFSSSFSSIIYVYAPGGIRGFRFCDMFLLCVSLCSACCFYAGAVYFL